MKKKILSTLMASLLLMSLIGTATAANSYSNFKNGISEIVLRAEETEWYYRVVNGQTQKRLWSRTEGVWLTDWIDC